jgi:hypothetical protein
MVLFAPAPSQQAAAAAAEQQAFSSRAGTPAITPAAAAAPKQQPAASKLKGSSGAVVQQQQPESGAVADLQQQVVAAAAADDDAAAADALRDGLSRFMSGLPEASLHSFWGSSSRCEVWTAALAAAQQPRDFAALITQLELMLLTDSWRMGWQLWAQPAQNPELVHTWPQVGFRLAERQQQHSCCCLLPFDTYVCLPPLYATRCLGSNIARFLMSLTCVLGLATGQAQGLHQPLTACCVCCPILPNTDCFCRSGTASSD